MCKVAVHQCKWVFLRMQKCSYVKIFVYKNISLKLRYFASNLRFSNPKSSYLKSSHYTSSHPHHIWASSYLRFSYLISSSHFRSSYFLPSHLESSYLISSYLRHICTSSYFRSLNFIFWKPHLVFTFSDLHQIIILSHNIIKKYNFYNLKYLYFQYSIFKYYFHIFGPTIV